MLRLTSRRVSCVQRMTPTWSLEWHWWTHPTSWSSLTTRWELLTPVCSLAIPLTLSSSVERDSPESGDYVSCCVLAQSLPKLPTGCIYCCPVFNPPVITPVSPVDVVEGMNLTLTCNDESPTTRLATYNWSNSTTLLIDPPLLSFTPVSVTLTNIKRSASGVYTCSISLPSVNLPPKMSIVTVNVQCESACI